MISKREMSEILRKVQYDMNDDFMYFGAIAWIYLIIGIYLGHNGCDHDYVFTAGASIFPLSILFAKQFNKEREKK